MREGRSDVSVAVSIMNTSCSLSFNHCHLSVWYNQLIACCIFWRASRVLLLGLLSGHRMTDEYERMRRFASDPHIREHQSSNVLRAVASAFLASVHGQDLSSTAVRLTAWSAAAETASLVTRRVWIYRAAWFVRSLWSVSISIRTFVYSVYVTWQVNESLHEPV